MPRTKNGTAPSYRHQKSRNLAKVTIRRQDFYLGKYNSPESYAKYAQVLALFNDGKSNDEIKEALTGDAAPPTPQAGRILTVGQLSLRYWNEYASTYYASSTGLSRGRIANVRAAIRAANDVAADVLVANFTTAHFKQIRETLIRRELSRVYINDLMALVIDMIRWGVELDLVSVTTLLALKEVKRLHKGKSAAKETAPVEPVSEADIKATLPHLQPILQDMVQVQRLIGARPIEICTMRVGEITHRTDGILCYRPEKHKTTHKGKERRLFIGPKAQKLLRPYLKGAPDDFVFTHAWKGEPLPYARESYTRAIVRACRRGKIKPWGANQLRHTRATEVREQYDLETASAVLGHSSPDVTLIYADANFEKAAEVARMTG